LGKGEQDLRGGFMETFLKLIGVIFIGAFYLAMVALSLAVPAAIVWAAYHFITTYKG
jgi:hypothetical protein